MPPLLRLAAERIALGMLTLFCVSIIVFGAVNLLPGDLAEEVLGQDATPESVAAFRRELGLDRPALERYLHWISDIAAGDLGRSLASQRPIAELIGQRLVNTLALAAWTAVIAVPLSVGLGVLAALWRGRLADRAINVVSLTVISLPEFFVAYILIFVFAVSLRWLPSMANVDPALGAGEWLQRILLPAAALTLGVAAHMIRMTRAAIVNLLASPWIEMARLKGIAPAAIVLRHALPNALAPIINVVALNLAYLVVGVVVVEVVFVYPGLGQLLVDSVAKRDIPVVQAASLIFAATYVLLNLLADLLAIASNPRLRHRR